MSLIQKEIKTLFVFAIATAFPIFLYASQSDSLQQNNSVSTEKILHLNTIWSQSANPASIQYFNFKNKIGKVYLNLNHQKGKFQLFQQEKEKRELGFFTNGYTSLNNWKFYGDFNYSKQTNEGVKWVDVLDTYNDNPYTLGDERGGTYFEDYFKIRGKGAYQSKGKIAFGFDMKYLAGVGARRKDPRPENEITSFDFLPGIVFHLNKIKLGLNLRCQTAKEDVDFKIVTDSVYSFYHFKGLGVFTKSFEKEVISSESDLLGGSLQLNFNKRNFSNLSEIGFYQKNTEIKRGQTFPLQVVLLEKLNTSVASTFSFFSTEKTLSKLELTYNNKLIYGHEPVVTPKLELVSFQWSTVAKYTLYWHKEQEYGIDFSYYKIRDDHHFNWGGKLSGSILTSESTYYFVPEFNQQNLNYYFINGIIEKELHSKGTSFIFSSKCAFRKGFNSSLDITDNEILLEGVNTDFVNHDFGSFEKPLLQFGVSIQMGRMVHLNDSDIQFFIEADYMHTKSKMNENPERNELSIKLGVNF